jgi:hypothetical protein
MLSSVYQDPVVSSLVAAAVAGSLAWLWRKLVKQQAQHFAHLEGDWFAHLLVRQRQELVIHELSFKIGYNPFRPLKIAMQELSDEQFRYHGYAVAKDKYLFCYLDGKSQFDRSFVVLRVPFNKGIKLDYLNGIMTGITHREFPGSTFLLLARARLTTETVESEFPANGGPIIVDTDPKQVEERKLGTSEPRSNA